MKELENIFSDCGLNVQRYERVHGGDINNAYCLITSSGKYLLKVNDKNRYPLMFQKEAGSLDLLRKNCSVIIPQVIKYGATEDTQWLILEWLEKGMPQKETWENFGQALAMMHKQPQHYFGFNENNYIGSLEQVNKVYNDWATFYADCRIMPLVKNLFNSGAYTLDDVNAANSLCKKLENIFPKEPASLLHGDLWAGNYLVHTSGFVAIYDPAVYFGHREVDIAMTKLFGGYDQRFYDAYDHHYPMEKDWQRRLPLSQLYPLLVHAVLFGGHYVSSSLNIIKQFS